MVNQSHDAREIGSGDAYKIGFLLIDGFALMSYACLAEPARAANLLAGRQLYHTCNVAFEPMVHSSSGAAVACQMPDSCRHRFDLVLVVAGGDPMQVRDHAIFDWLGKLDRQGVVLGGVSGGPVILARAGLLKGRRMTVHWEHAASLDWSDYGALLERALFVIDRDRITCSGGTAPLDLMHMLIARKHGRRFAQLVSDWFMHTHVRQAQGPQRAGLIERFGTTNRIVLVAVELMESHVGDTLTLRQLAQLSEVSPRQLNRVFRDAFSMSTMRFYAHLRLRAARQMLSVTALPVATIAEATGFSGPGHFSTAFTRSFGVSPSRFRHEISR